MTENSHSEANVFLQRNGHVTRKDQQGFLGRTFLSRDRKQHGLKGKLRFPGKVPFELDTECPLLGPEPPDRPERPCSPALLAPEGTLVSGLTLTSPHCVSKRVIQTRVLIEEYRPILSHWSF